MGASAKDGLTAGEVSRGPLGDGWPGVTLLVDRAAFVAYAPETATGLEAASALARLFGALVLSYFFADEPGGRLHRVAAGIGFCILRVRGRDANRTLLVDDHAAFREPLAFMLGLEEVVPNAWPGCPIRRDRVALRKGLLLVW